jgi:hypothetical protein
MKPEDLAPHARALAVAFEIRLIEDSGLKTEQGGAAAEQRVVIVAPIVDEATYAVALHEMGHLVAPLGFLKSARAACQSRERLMAVKLAEEEAAWEWAEHYALEWTLTMQAVRDYGYGTYERALMGAGAETRLVRSLIPAKRVMDAKTFASRIKWGS